MYTRYPFVTASDVAGNVGVTGKSRTALSPSSEAVMHPPFPPAVQSVNTTPSLPDAAVPSVAVEPAARVRERAPPSPEAWQEVKDVPMIVSVCALERVAEITAPEEVDVEREMKLNEEEAIRVEDAPEMVMSEVAKLHEAAVDVVTVIASRLNCPAVAEKRGHASGVAAVRVKERELKVTDAAAMMNCAEGVGVNAEMSLVGVVMLGETVNVPERSVNAVCVVSASCV